MHTNPPTTPAAPSPTIAAALERAKLLALGALTDILNDPDAPHREKRLAAVAILKHATASEPKPAPAPSRACAPRDTRATSHSAPNLHDARAALRERYPNAHGFDRNPQAAADLLERTEDLEIAYNRGYQDATHNRPRKPMDVPDVTYERLTRSLETDENGHATPSSETRPHQDPSKQSQPELPEQ